MIFDVVKTKRRLLLHDRICRFSREVSSKMWIAYTEVGLLCNGRPTILENRAASNIKQYGKFTSGLTARNQVKVISVCDWQCFRLML